jgi:hypothetical protein
VLEKKKKKKKKKIKTIKNVRNACGFGQRALAFRQPIRKKDFLRLTYMTFPLHI